MNNQHKIINDMHQAFIIIITMNKQVFIYRSVIVLGAVNLTVFLRSTSYGHASVKWIIYIYIYIYILYVTDVSAKGIFCEQRK